MISKMLELKFHSLQEPGSTLESDSNFLILPKRNKKSNRTNSKDMIYLYYLTLMNAPATALSGQQRAQKWNLEPRYEFSFLFKSWVKI